MKIDCGIYTEDATVFSLECWKCVELKRREIIIFSPTTVRTGSVCNERMKLRDISLHEYSIVPFVLVCR